MTGRSCAQGGNGAKLRTNALRESVRLLFNRGRVRVRAPIVPGMVRDVAVREWRQLGPDEPVELRPGGGVVALDGEKEHELSPDATVTVTLTRRGPRVVEIRDTIELAARAGAFVAKEEVPWSPS